MIEPSVTDGDAANDRPSVHAFPSQVGPGEDLQSAFLRVYRAILESGSTPVDSATLTEIDAALTEEKEANVGLATHDFLDVLNQLRPRPGNVLNELASHSTTLEETDAAEPLAKLGLKLGRYQINGLLGRGGHGVVFRAFDPALKRLVALKVPSPKVLASSSLRGWFLKEARAVARLDHPGIVSIHDIGQSGMVVYLVSTLVPGVNLVKWLSSRAEPVPPHLAAELVLKLTEAVAHAHSRGVLHRDLKPSNILLEMADEDQDGCTSNRESGPIPRITDFGLAEMLDDRRAEPRMRSSPVGTPRFMAPEQGASGAREVGPQADIYALGAILHTLLTREPPGSPLGDSDPLEIAGSDIPEALRDIMTRCLRSRPESRYQTAETLADGLRQFLNTEAFQADAPTSSVARVRRMRRVAVLAAGLLVSVAALSRLWPVTELISTQVQTESVTKTQRNLEAELPRKKYVDDIQEAARFITDQRDAGQGELFLNRWANKSGVDDPRGFEWGYLKRLAHRESLTLLYPLKSDGKPNSVYHIRFAPDGRSLASAGEDNTVRLWDSATGAVRGILRHNSEVNWVGFSPDGRLAATACDDSSVWVWDLATLVPLQRLENSHEGKAAVCVEFLPDSKQLISGGRDGRLVLRNVADSKIVLAIASGLKEIETLAVAASNPDGLVVAGGKGRPGIILTDFKLKAPSPLPTGEAQSVLAVAIDPTTHIVAAPVLDEVWFWDVSRDPAVPLPPVRYGFDQSFSVAFHPSEKQFAVTGGKGNPIIQIWDFVDRERLKVLTGHSNRIWSTDFSPDGKTLATASDDGTAKIFDLEKPPDRSVWNYPRMATSQAFGLRVGPDSTVSLRIVQKDGSIDDVDLGNGVVKTIRSPLPWNVGGVSITPDGRFSAAVEARKGGVIEVRDLESSSNETMIATAVVGDKPILALRPDGGTLVVAGLEPALIQIISRESREEIKRFPSESNVFSRMVLSPDGRQLCGIRGSIFLWNLDHEVPDLHTVSASDWLNAQVFSPDGRILAVAGKERTILLFDAMSLSPLASLQGHSQSVHSLAFSPDGRVLASGDTERIHLWDVELREELLAIPAPGTGPIAFLTFSRDGKTLVAASSGGLITAWHTFQPSTALGVEPPPVKAQ